MVNLRLFLPALLTASTLAWFGKDVQADMSDQTIELATRTFDLRASTDRLSIYLDEGFVPLQEVKWIRDLTGSDPYLHPTVIHITDRGRGPGTPVWAPDDKSRLHMDDSLHSVFDNNEYNIWWRGAGVPTNRGTVLLVPRQNSESYVVACAYDRSEQGPNFCSIRFRYDPDPDLWVKIRVYNVTLPLNDFREIKLRVEALIRCLDITEALASNDVMGKPGKFSSRELDEGGRCRQHLMS